MWANFEVVAAMTETALNIHDLCKHQRQIKRVNLFIIKIIIQQEFTYEVEFLFIIVKILLNMSLTQNVKIF